MIPASADLAPTDPSLVPAPASEHASAPAPATEHAPTTEHALEPREWAPREAAHRERADALTAGRRDRTLRHEKHPIEDFLFTYYSVTPGQLRRWHPGAGVVLVGAGIPESDGALPERAGWREYRAVASDRPDDLVFDAAAFLERRGSTVDFVDRLLRSTLERPATLGCFGLHEWAMVYRQTPDELRHSSLPLRLGHAGTDAVVEANPIRCSHFDAFRFFTPEAVPRNELRPTRATQPDMEQPGCLHAGMDVYKWASKLGPAVPGELLLDCFVLARDIRELDMRASPYDVTGWAGADGRPLEPVAIETPDGKREYARLQAGFAERGNALRERVLDAIGDLRRAGAGAGC